MLHEDLHFHYAEYYPSFYGYYLETSKHVVDAIDDIEKYIAKRTEEVSDRVILLIMDKQERLQKKVGGDSYLREVDKQKTEVLEQSINWLLKLQDYLRWHLKSDEYAASQEDSLKLGWRSTPPETYETFPPSFRHRFRNKDKRMFEGRQPRLSDASAVCRC